MTNAAPRSGMPCRRRRLIVALVPVLLGGCSIPLGGPAAAPQSAEQRSLVDACRQRADEAYELTHRGQIYAAGSQVNTPFSANYQPGVQDRGFADLYAHDRMVSDCVRNTGAQGSRVPPGAAPGMPAPGIQAPGVRSQP